VDETEEAASGDQAESAPVRAPAVGCDAGRG